MPPRPQADDDGQAQPTARADARRRAAPATGKTAEPRILGLPRTTAIVIGAAFVGALVWFVWRRRSASGAAASTTTATSTTASTSTGTPPYQGIPPWLAAGASTTTSTSTGTGGGTSASTGTATKTSTTTSTTANGTAPTSTLPPPANVHATATTKTTITVAWNRVTGATAYRIRVTYQDKLVTQQFTTGPVTSAKISGLGADHTYGVHLASVSTNGIGSEGDTDIKTSK